MFIFVYQRKIHIRGLIVTIQQIKQEIAELKEAIKEKMALPWDCKSLMNRYQAEISRREILCKLYDFTGVALKALRACLKIKFESTIGIGLTHLN